MYLELIGLRQHGHRRRRGVHTSLCLCGRHALHTMHARFIFQRAIDICPRDSKVDFLIASDGAFRHTRDRQLPTFRVAVALIHLEQVAGKETGLVATRTCTDLHLHVFRVLWVLRNEGNLDFLFQLGLQGLVGGQFLAGHLLHLRIVLVGKDILGLLDAVQTGNIPFAGVHDVAQILVFLGQFHKTVLIGYHVRVGDQCRHLLKSRLQTV